MGVADGRELRLAGTTRFRTTPRPVVYLAGRDDRREFAQQKGHNMHAEQLEKLENELKELLEKKEALEDELAPVIQRIERLQIEIRYLGVAADHQII